MDPAQSALFTGIAVAILSYVVNPWIQNKLQKQRENDPTLGWRLAVKNLEDRVDALEDENKTLEIKVASLEEQVNDKSAIIARQVKTINEQNRMIDARDRYLSRLRGIWTERFPGEEFPGPLPSYAYWMNYTPEGSDL